MEGCNIDLFWIKVNIKEDDECWFWNAAKTPLNYGQFRVGPTMQLAHRVAYCLVNGSIPEGKLVLHTCNNPPCCNPEHLYIGTPLENANDRSAHGRSGDIRGQFNGRAKLTEEEVIEIREVYAEGGISYRELSIFYNISKRQIHRVVNELSWNHV